ncbi:nucleotide-diphospho-sugar transferase [Microdochium trichocladiopsis]|uniref:Translation initiation factor eIF2B subunit gamma n=1 Tax=Microdochium trichocladiopsis TaxID=1682393 RepID=A0A9P8YH43_9PEZI|nr:nucleotide-diphospho-sugar transferase [Microdochium trichocladiopsis]KAH7039892.1 nucleotide-diphospho-sugar transferase [Microdochium trichocladiopsis]
MPHAVSMPATGLQAIILCGPGSSFPTFTANPDEHPKALLPVANRPMVWYPIDFCYRMGITNTTIICPPSAEKAISTALNTNPFLTSLPHPRPDLLAPKELDQNTGTAEILRLPEVRELITSDFVILPCDLVCELGGDKLLQAWMVQASSLSDPLSDDPSSTRSGGLGVWYDTKAGTPVKGEETDFVATTPLPKRTTPVPKDSFLSHLSSVALSMPTDSLKDLMEEKTGLPIRHGLLRKHPKLQMLTSYRDAHIYILPRWIMDFVQQNERLESIGEDVIGWWAKATWQDGLSKKLGLASVLGGHATTGVRSPASPSRMNESMEQSPDIGPSDRQVEIPKMLAYVHPSSASGPLIRRVDTAQLLLSVSLQIAKLPSLEETGPDNASPFAHAKKVAYPEGVKPRTTITRQDSLVADNVMVEEKTSIKECVIGANCQIKEGAKLFQCVLMDGVTVGKGCKLTRCILGKRSEIGEGSTLTECEVQENLLVEAKTEDKDMKFMSSSGLEASEQEIEASMAEQDAEDGEQENTTSDL